MYHGHISGCGRTRTCLADGNGFTSRRSSRGNITSKLPVLCQTCNGDFDQLCLAVYSTSPWSRTKFSAFWRRGCNLRVTYTNYIMSKAIPKTSERPASLACSLQAICRLPTNQPFFLALAINFLRPATVFPSPSNFNFFSQWLHSKVCFVITSSRGTSQNRTDDVPLCRRTPYHLAIVPYLKKRKARGSNPHAAHATSLFSRQISPPTVRPSKAENVGFEPTRRHTPTRV